ncbi:PAS domain S-box protein [Geomonas paludis]|uniref:histidine kinase n=3 Tax=Geomonas paludis TaxID=2740185 RepID=A0A6V8MQL3_9BACT|nr:PAS domain S-box protein [Geomonas paludis]UPU36168.1 PAS domain S-box protein [Geomonas paludis]GFO62222.1 hypothetical protein GMPD_01410 [Geomonas paludis]
MDCDQQLEKLRQEKDVLAQQVKRLIKAEGKLYDFQQELDQQLKEYKALYEFSRNLSGSYDVEYLSRATVEYVIQQLEYERAIVFRRCPSGRYAVCSFDGYYDPAEKEEISRLSFDDAHLPLISADKEYVCCTALTREPWASDWRSTLHLNEFYAYPLGYGTVPHAVLVAGNSAENSPFYRKVEATPRALLSMGNLAGLVSSLLENQVYFEQLMEAREQERLAEARYRSIFENAAEGIFQRTPEGRYLSANPALAHMLGYVSPAELMTEVTDIRSQVYVDPLYYDELMRQLQASGRVDGFETEMSRKDGSTMWVSMSIRIVRGSDGKIAFLEGMVEEITKRKEAEDALRDSERAYRELSEALEQRVIEAVDELRQKDKMLIMQGRQAVLGEMLSNIAHQWRQPLNMLALLAQDLQLTNRTQGLTAEHIDGNIGRTMEIIEKMSRTIDDFRYFFRPDQRIQKFRAREPMEKALSLLEGSFGMHGIHSELSVSGEPVISGYLSEFVQVLLNILMNARDALVAKAPAAPLISISMFSEGDRTVVTISDNAGGIPDEIIGRIFEPYFTTKGPEQGTGIGLFMCKTIIEKSMKGLLTARNTGTGAEFRIEVSNS